MALPHSVGPCSAKIVSSASYICCEDFIVHYAQDGADNLKWSPGPACSSFLAFRGEVFQGGADASKGNEDSWPRPLAWEHLADELLRLPPEPDAYRQCLSNFRGSFWFAHVRQAIKAQSGESSDGEPLVMLTACDEVGTMPMWLGANGRTSCFASPFVRSSLSREARNCSPRLVYSWSSTTGLKQSIPSVFFGLHSWVRDSTSHSSSTSCNSNKTPPTDQLQNVSGDINNSSPTNTNHKSCSSANGYSCSNFSIGSSNAFITKSSAVTTLASGNTTNLSNTQTNTASNTSLNTSNSIATTTCNTSNTYTDDLSNGNASSSNISNNCPTSSSSTACSSAATTTEMLEKQVVQALRRCVLPRPERIGILFSGGLDSGLLAHLCARGDIGPDCRCIGYTVGFHTPERGYPEDLSAAEIAAAKLGIEWRHRTFGVEEAEELLQECAALVADWNPVKGSVGMTILAACQLAAKDGVNRVLSGLGSEEAFAGYFRHVRACAEGSDATARDRTVGLAQMWHRDLQRDFQLAAHAGVEIRYPFLDADILSLALKLPASAEPSREVTRGALEESLAAADGGKGALRAVARLAGAPSCIYERKKRAAQYGSRFHQALTLLSSRPNASLLPGPARFKQARYVMALPGAFHGPLALIFSSGKDSIQAYCLHRTFNIRFACVIPALWHGDEERTRAGAEAAKDFAEKSGLALLEVPAPILGKPRAGYDIRSLADSLVKVRDNFAVEGVTCGHVCDLDLWGSLSQACDVAGLRSYAPMWGVPASDSVMARAVTDGETVLVPTLFPDPNFIGRRLSTPAHIEEAFKALRCAAGADARDDTDGGLVDCKVEKSAFF